MSPTAVVIGASLAGLFAAAALADRGYRITVLERDRLPSEAIPRKGVPQDTQIHVLLHRGLLAAESLLPGFQQDLIHAGAARFDGGRMLWLGEFGWLDNRIGSYELLSGTRPLLEQVVRRRVTALPEVTIIDGAQVTALNRDGARWRVEWRGDTEPAAIEFDVAVDASGRGSRLPRWLADLGIEVGDPQLVDAHLGYACRLYRSRGPLPVHAGRAVANTPDTGSGGLAMPVENDHWLLMAGGNGDLRPSRDADEFVAFLGALRDPALAELADLLEPVSNVAIHRQTGNRRYPYGRAADWPDGLLSVGDSMSAFNPIYGQGMTVAAREAEVLRSSLRAGILPGRRLQRRLSAVADLPWRLATAQDLRQLGTDPAPNPAQRLLGRWVIRLAELMAHGDAAATTAFMQIYHLMAPPMLLLHPALVASAARSLVAPSQPVPRPAELEVLSRLHAVSVGRAA